MSRIGNRILALPKGVELTVEKGNVVKVKGSKGTLTQAIDPELTVSVENGEVKIDRPTDQKRHKSLHGLYNALLNNMIKGVNEGFKHQLELVGVGYRATNRGQLLEMSLGYAHPVMFYVPDEVKLTTVTEKGSNPTVILESSDKQLLGQIAAKIKAFRKIEPYKGKGIRTKGEWIRRKAGKTAAK